MYRTFLMWIDSSLATLPANHPLLQEAQQALSLQLRKKIDKLKDLLLDRQRAARDVEQQHESVGQSLFESQSKLKGLQEQIQRLQRSEEEAKEVGFHFSPSFYY